MRARAIMIGIGAACLAGCSTTRVDQYAPRVVERFELRPYAVHEECRHLERDDRLDYRFESSDPVTFDLHYRDGNAVVMPIVRPQAREDAGVYLVPFPEDFCLSWEAGREGTRLSYRFEVRQSPP